MDHSFSLQFIEIVTEGLKFKRQIYLVYNLELWNLDPAMKGTDINLGGASFGFQTRPQNHQIAVR